MMAQYQNDELEYMINDYIEMGEFEDEDDDLKENSLGKHDEISDYEDDDDYVDMGKQKADTSASEARDGKDIQGIPWERMINTRDQYRESRLKQYKNYVSLSHSRSEVEKVCKQVQKGSSFYDFQFNTRLVKSTIVHFQ